VPLLLHVPGVEPRRIATRRSAIDVAPTLLDLFGAPAPSGQGTDFMSGESLLADLSTPPGQNPKQRPIYVDMAAGPYNAERQAYIEGDLKLVLSGARALSLFDLNADPGEKTDLLDRADLFGPLQSRFKAFRASLRPVRVDPRP
jgi:arylsulfatase A-like enzyme